jgi:hypothetical protein
VSRKPAARDTEPCSRGTRGEPRRAVGLAGGCRRSGVAMPASSRPRLRPGRDSARRTFLDCASESTRGHLHRLPRPTSVRCRSPTRRNTNFLVSWYGSYELRRIYPASIANAERVSRGRRCVNSPKHSAILDRTSVVSGSLQARATSGPGPGAVVRAALHLAGGQTPSYAGTPSNPRRRSPSPQFLDQTTHPGTLRALGSLTALICPSS